MEKRPLERIRGQVERVTYANDETGFAVLKVRVPGRRDLVTVVGNVLAPSAGEILSLRGEWGSHPKFGEQFKLAFATREVPATSAGIEKYLGSGLVKGIGPKMARRIVALFGEETLNVIEEEPERLQKVEGIGKARIETIRKAWAEQKEIREVMVFLQSHGVSAGYATKIFRSYGNDAIRTVQENPYRLAYDIYGIGFLTADAIARKLGFAEDSPLRIEAGLLYALYSLVDAGHVYGTRAELEKSAQELLRQESIPGLQAALERLVIDERVIRENDARGEAIYLAGYYRAEIQAANRLALLAHTRGRLRRVDFEKAASWAEHESGMRLSEQQREALQASLQEKLLIITGGPGTGKSTLISVILRVFDVLTNKILLAAPTGRAAKRMTELTGREAKTIHRLLCYDVKLGGFKKNEDDPLDCDLLILDEVSMVDLLLFHHLLKAVPPRATVIFVGDINQLPSVGAGSVLHDLIASRRIPCVFLRAVFRQAESSTIIRNAHAIIRGEKPAFHNREEDDMFFLEEDDAEKIVETIAALAERRLPKKYSLHPVEDIQVLSPMNRGPLGTERLNASLQEVLNPGAHGITRGSRLFKVGDKVMQIRNNYDKDVYNGDIGRIAFIDEEGQVLSVSFDGRYVPYEYTDLDELVLAYAISIHKSQGGEYPCVIIPCSTKHYVMLQRNLLYTGVTRGKRLVVLVGTQKALGMAIRNTRVMQRNSKLSERMGVAWKKEEA